MLWFFWALISGARADDGDDGLSDFSNDLATDLAPLLTLFGDAITKQYLSESTSFLDYLIFAMGPIGVLTAMVSTIRVCGHSSLRAFIGRSQEGEATVEAELCTSTSRDVCELFNRGGIARVLGRPNVLELVYTPRGGIEEPPLVFNHGEIHGDRTLNLSHMFFERASGLSDSSVGWRRAKDKLPAKIAPNPNLSLNVGIVKRPEWVHVAIAATGILLQTGVLVLAGVGVWVLGWNLNGGRASPMKHYAPVMFIAGTILMCLGMWSCAYLIGQTTEEIRFQRCKPYWTAKDPGGNPYTLMHRSKPKPQLFWLQPGPQVIGDQSFDSFGYVEDPANPLQVWTSSRKEFQDTFELRTYFAVLAVLTGYIAQFIGLRGIKAWVSLAQLGICIVMSILRGYLRMQRLDKKSNQLSDKLDIVSGHELDWLAYQIVPQELEWTINARSAQSLDKSSSHDEHPVPRTSTDPTSTGEDAVSLYNLFRIRSRLAQLTGLASPDEILNSKCQRWTDESVKVRTMARKMSAAICRVAEKHLDKLLTSEYHLSIPMVAYNPRRNHHCRSELHLRLHLNRQDIWELDPASIETALGLWMWALVDDPLLRDHDPATKDVPVFRILSLTPDLGNAADDIANREAEIRFWCGFVSHEEEHIRLEGQPWYSYRSLWGMDSDGHAYRLQKGAITSMPERRYCGWTSVCEDVQPGFQGEFRALTTRLDPGDTSIHFDIVAQDLLTVLLVSLTRYITFGQTKLTMEHGLVRPINPTINDLANAFTECGLSNARLCIIPALRERLPLPPPQDLLDAILDRRDQKGFRHQLHLVEAVPLLKWSCVQFNFLQGEECKVFEQALRAVGETYRILFGKRWQVAHVGRYYDDLIHWMHRTYIGRAQDDLVVREILECYRDIEQRLKQNRMTPYREQEVNEKKETCLNLLRALEGGDRTETLYRLCFISPEAFHSDTMRPALSLAVRNGWTEVLRNMLHLDADPDSRDENGRSAVSYAAELGLEQHLKALIKRGADLDQPDNNQQTPLYYAAEKGNEGIVKILVDHGTVDIHRANKDGHNALWAASKYGHKAIMEDLLKRGASPDCRKGEYDRAPLFYAASHGYTALALDMVDRMSNWEDAETGRELLAVAESRGYTELIDKLHGTVANFS